MTRAEWLEVAAFVVDLWPSQAWKPETVASSFQLFERISQYQAREAVRLLAETGREFAPPPGLVVATARSVVEARPMLEEPDLTRDLTPEEQERNRARAARLKEQLAELANRKVVCESAGEFRLKLSHSHLPKTLKVQQ